MALCPRPPPRSASRSFFCLAFFLSCLLRKRHHRRLRPWSSCLEVRPLPLEPTPRPRPSLHIVRNLAAERKEGPDLAVEHALHHENELNFLIREPQPEGEPG